MNNLKNRSADSALMLPYWQEVEIILQGQRAVREAAEMFLPKMPNESQKQYEFRLKLAKFTNIYRDTAEALCAKPFEEEISLVEGDDENVTVPQQIKDFIENVDGDGNNLTVFSAQLFFNGINDAIGWVLVDFPKTDATIRTVADMKRARIRPFWSIVLAKNVLEVRSDKTNGDSIINYIRILEPKETQDGKDRVRIFERDESGVVNWSLHEDDDKSKDGFTQIDGGTLSIDQIPVVPFITGWRDGKRFVFLPPLQDALELQKTLYMQESALEYAKTMTAYPMLSASGVNPERGPDGKPLPISIGPQAVLYAPRDGDGNVGSWSYVEPGAQSLKFLAEDVKETKQDLRELGKQPLTAQAGLTVVTTAYAAGKSRSAVKSWGLGLKDTLENCLLITAKWLGVQYEPEVIVYDEYDDLTDEDFTSVMELRRNRDISQKTVWNEAKRRGILASEFNEEIELERLLEETPADLMEDQEFDTRNPDDET